MIGVASRNAWKRRMAVRPSMPGSRTSSTITSGRWAWASSMPSSADAAVAIVCPISPANWLSPQQMLCSSSTTSR